MDRLSIPSTALILDSAASLEGNVSVSKFNNNGYLNNTMSGDQSLTNFTEVPELVPKEVISLRMLLSIVLDKETCTDCQSIIPNVFRKICNMLISQEFGKFRVINFAKRQVVADGRL